MSEGETKDYPVMEQKDSFKLTLNAKGDYQWEIRIAENDHEELKRKIKALDEWARQTYKLGGAK